MAYPKIAEKIAAADFVVVGGGIAGLGFAIAARLQGLNGRVVILERGGIDDVERRRDYGHSLSIRNDQGGVKAARDLGVFDELSKLVTPSLGFIVVDASRGSSELVLDTNWFANLHDSSMAHGLRLMRYDLWSVLRDAAVKAGAEIVYNVKVTGAELVDSEGGNAKNVRLLTANGERLLTRGVLIAADGHRSAVRRALHGTEHGELSFCGVVILGAKVRRTPSEMPPLARERHGLVVGPCGTSMFVADEGNGVLLVSMSLRSEQPLAADALRTDTALRERVRTAVAAYASPWRELLEVFTRADADSFVTNCFDKLPTPPVLGGARVVFIGDACHAVSPFAGAGANMALLDALALATRLAHAPSGNIASALQGYFDDTRRDRERVVHAQRRLISALHTQSTLGLVGRRALFAVAPLALNPRKRRVALLALAGAVVVALAVVARRPLTEWWWS